MGGILLWSDPQNLLRLDRGTRGRGEISLMGCLHGKDLVFGRGRLPAERVFLRLERGPAPGPAREAARSRVTARCSVDGRNWFTVGQVEFPVGPLLQIGLYGVGNIDRTLYPGVHPEGASIRFEEFRLWS